MHLHLGWLVALLYLLLSIHFLGFALDLHYAQIPSCSGLYNQEIFLSLGTVGVINDKTSRKAGFESSRGDHFKLMFAIRVELQNSPRSNTQTLIQRLEEFAAPFERVIVFPTRHAQPLNGRYTYRTVEHPRSEFPTLTDVNLPQSPSRLLLFRSDIQHISTDINALPNKPIFLDGLTRDARPTANIKNEVAFLKVKQFKCAFGQLPLDVLYTGVGLVLGGLGGVVPQLWWKLILRTHIILSMKYLKSIKPFQLISTIVEKTKEKVNRNSLKNTEKDAEADLNAKLQSQVGQVDYDNAQTFLVALRKVSSERQQSENILRRKIDLFQRVQIEPHYLSPTDNKKLLDFQFQLGSDIFLERVQHLQQQNMDITAVIEQVISRRKADAFVYMEELTVLGQEVEKILAKIAKFRGRLVEIKKNKVYEIWLLMKRKNIIKNKIRLLKKMKQKNEMAFIEITNIDQAFATEQNRAKLYDKIKKLTQIEKSTYISIVRNKLITTAKNVKQMVENGIASWLSNKLKQNQIQKIVVLIYYIMQKSVYRQNNITIDFKKFDKTKLRICISSIFQWQNFTYVKNMVTKEKINEFLNILLDNIR